MCRIALTASLLLAVACRVPAADLDYVRDVRPILQTHCYRCHGEEKQKSGLRLDIKSEAFKGGDGWGPSVVAGKSNKSTLIELVNSEQQD